VRETRDRASLRGMAIELELVQQTAREAVEAAARVALPHWERGVAVETKADRSPVTIADRLSEEAILQLIGARFPEHAILAEESGARTGEGGRWIIDPIDGTRGFSRGGKFWGPLVAFEQDGEVLAGALALPALGLVYSAARGRGCWRNGERCRVSQVGDLRDATLSLGELGWLLGPPHGDAVTRLIRGAASARCYGDLAGVAMVLDGLADVWLEAGVKPWDLAATRILLEEAGGRFTSFVGDTDLGHGTAVGSNGRLHAAVLDALR
jgi:histidinol-phosphatase